MSSTTILRPLFRGLTLAAVALVAACGGDGGGPSGPSAPSEPPVPTVPPAPVDPAPEPGPVSGLEGRAIFGLTCANQLVLFGSGNPETLQRQVQITGMTAGAVMLGIDFRGLELHGIGSDDRMYSLDTLTGVATAKGDAFIPASDGEHFGLAYDAAQDRLHLSGVESDQSLSIDAATGAVSNEWPDLAYDPADPSFGTNPAVTAGAYYGPALFGIETNANALVSVSQATGKLTTVKELPFNVYLCGGLDIDTDGTAYAALSTDNGSELYTIDVLTGNTTLLGEIAGSPVHSLALRP